MDQGPKRASGSMDTIAVVNPATEAVIATVTAGDRADADNGNPAEASQK